MKKIIISILLVLMIVFSIGFIFLKDYLALALTVKTLMTYDDFDFEIEFDANIEAVEYFLDKTPFDLEDLLSIQISGSYYQDRSCGDIKFITMNNVLMLQYYLDEDKLKLFNKDKFPIGLHFEIENSESIPTFDGKLSLKEWLIASDWTSVSVAIPKEILLSYIEDDNFKEFVSKYDYPIHITFKKNLLRVEQIEVSFGNDSDQIKMIIDIQKNHTRNFYIYNRLTVDANYIME